jgi:hypothetical protein
MRTGPHRPMPPSGRLQTRRRSCRWGLPSAAATGCCRLLLRGSQQQAQCRSRLVCSSAQLPLLQTAIVALQATVDKFTPPPGYRPPAACDERHVRALLSYAHRLSYSSSAPLGFQPGQPLYFFKPPAPQEAEMRASQLHSFARERAAGRWPLLMGAVCDGSALGNWPDDGRLLFADK